MTPQRLGYLLFMLLAAGAFVLARRLFPAPPAVAALPTRHKLLLAWAAFVGGVMGAKLPFINTNTWLGDGKTLTTGLIGGYLAVEIAKYFLGIRTKTGDAWALPLALGLAVGRWGCFCNGCCFGTPTDLPWACTFGDGIPRHPTQAYESLFHLIMASVLIWLTARGWLVTHRLQFYLIAYGLYRFSSEYIRPEPRDYWGLTYYQWVALILIIGPALQWVYEVAAERARRDNHEEGG